MPATETIPYANPVAVVQPLPGIGDMVWHLPHINAIAAHAGAPVTVFAKPRSLADQLLANEPAVARVTFLDLNPAGRKGHHDGTFGFIRLIRLLRQGRFATIVLLHHSDSLAAAAWLAGIPDRRGYGWGRQKWFLNHGPYLPPEIKTRHQHTRATVYLKAAQIPMPTTEPALTLPPTPRSNPTTPYIAIGIGSSEKLRQWGSHRFAQLADALLTAGWPTIVLVGGREDEPAATSIRQYLKHRAAQVQTALGWDLPNVASLLAGAAFYVGNNTGVMNIAAAVGTRTYALFGTTKPFDHASQIVPITAPDTGTHDGMTRLTLQEVLTVIGSDRGQTIAQYPG